MASSLDRYKQGTALSVLEGSVAQWSAQWLNGAVLGEDLKLSNEEQKRVREAFDEYDYDRSGKIDKSQIRQLLIDLKWGVDQNQLNDFMTGVFGDNERAFNFDMFMKLYKAVLAKQPTAVRKQQCKKDGEKVRDKGRININDLRLLEADLRGLFKSMDEDKKGYLSIPDMRRVMRSSGLPDFDGDDFETVVHEQMCIADTSKDGKVSFEEFVGYRNQIIEYCYGRVTKEGDLGEEDPEMLQQFRFVD